MLADSWMSEDGTMRTVRLRYDRETCHYHLRNRVTGLPVEDKGEEAKP